MLLRVSGLKAKEGFLLASVVWLVLCLVAVSPFTMGAAISQRRRLRVIIGFREAADADLVRAHDGEIKYQYNIISAIVCFLPENVIDVLRAHPKVAYVEPDSIVRALAETLPWGVDRIDAEEVHEHNKGTGIKIAVLDTGIDYSHPDLGGRYEGGYDFVNEDSDPMDDNGHGTHVSGTIAAEDNEIGVIGVAPEAEIYALKVLDSDGLGYSSDVVAAIEWAVANGVQIISMSLSSNSDDPALHQACDAAYNEGLLLVAAAGNDWWGGDTHYPARYDSVIAVAATNIFDYRSVWSCKGPSTELSAPGVDIYSTYMDGTYAFKSGTSMACPHVSGTAALVFKSLLDPAYDSDSDGVWDASEVREKLKDTADDLGVPGWDQYYGWGLVDADEAAPQPADTTPPGKVTCLTVLTFSEAELGLDWQDNPEEDLHHYNVYRSETSGFTPAPENRVASPTTSSHPDSGLEASTTYYYKVTAVDLSGNKGEASDEASGTTFGDTAGPATSNTVVSPNPTDGAASVTLSASVDDSATGNSEIVEAEYFVDTIGEYGAGTAMSASDGAFGSPTEDVGANIDLSGWPLGDYTIYVHGKDVAGNWGPLDSVVLQVTEEPGYLMHVESIDMSKQVGWLKRAGAEVTIFDADGNPVEGATIYGTWSGLTSESEIGVTGSDGKAKFYTNPVSGIGGSCTFTVDDVTKTGHRYDSQANKETSDSITI